MSLSNDENEENSDNNQVRESNFVLARNINGDVRRYLLGQTQNQSSEDSAFSSDQTEVRGV